MKKLIILTLISLSLTLNTFSNESVCRHTYKDIVPLAQEYGFTITSTVYGRHNKGSKHPLGKAVDIRTRDKSPEQVEGFMSFLEKQGYIVLDERKRPRRQKYWSGPHIHVHVPDCEPPVEIFPIYEEFKLGALCATP